MRQPLDFGGSGLYYINRFRRSARQASRAASARSLATLTIKNTVITYTYRFKQLIIYDAVLRAELNTPAGELWRYLDVRADRAVRGAKRQAGKKTGRLRKSIHKRHLESYTGQYIWIGSDTVSYAYMHHEGTRPHIITPRDGNKNGRLIFRKGSRVVVTPRVNHPGTRPNPYLRDQLVHFRF